MPRTDIARRVYNHAWKLDPIVRSLLDTDFYKLLMLQFIWKFHPSAQVKFALNNRTKRVKLGQVLATRADIFGIQDRVTEAVVGAIEPSLRLAEAELAAAEAAATSSSMKANPVALSENQLRRIMEEAG